MRKQVNEITYKKTERALLLGVKFQGDTDWDVEQSLGELEQLTITAGATVVGRTVQQREKPHSRTFIGPGKADEIARQAKALSADLVIFDADLTPSQQQNIEEIIPLKVFDRTALILEIFAQRAHSSEGKLQVELAQLSYLLPRLIGWGVVLSRMGGGIGTRRGPGETKLEVDRRRIRKRIQHLKAELEEVKKHREVQRKRRKRTGVFNVSLVGYTNAGKSTLLNALTDADVLVEDKLFATLDSTSRQLDTQRRLPVVISDTVGFIRRLPHQLVAAFRSTLSEVQEADLLLHVIDASHPQVEEQIQSVEEVLGEIEAAEKPRVEVMNKTDKVEEPVLNRLRQRHPDAVFVSALESKGLSELVDEIEKRLAASFVRVRVTIPFTKGDLVKRLHAEGRIVSESHSADGTVILADVPRSTLHEVSEYESTG